MKDFKTKIEKTKDKKLMKNDKWKINKAKQVQKGTGKKEVLNNKLPTTNLG